MNYTQKHIELAVELGSCYILSVEDVMKFLGCNEDEANQYMHELVLSSVAEWDSRTASIKRLI